MKSEIYYFSGTGNSYHVATELQKRLPETKLLPIAGLLNKGEIVAQAETVGFVFPLYFTTIPAPVRRFLEKINIEAVRYTYAVVTRIGTFSVADRGVEHILRSKGKRLDARFMLNMAQNSPTGLKPGKGDKNWTHKISREKVAELEAAVQTHLDKMSRIIAGRERSPANVWPNPFMVILERLMYLLTRTMHAEVGYYTDDSCIGCGTCEKVCLSGKIRLEDGHPVWRKTVDCWYCFACFNFCPTQSILVKKKYTEKNGRYFHPASSADAIAGQKCI